MDEIFTLKAISPLDGRYWAKIAPLAEYFSEAALIKFRLYIEVHYLIFLSQKGPRKFLFPPQIEKLLLLLDRFNDQDLLRIKEIEKRINHDTKAVEYFLREKMIAFGLPGNEFLHFGFTSEDTDNLAYSLSLKKAAEEILLPELKKLIQKIGQMAKDFKAEPMLARTHGQPAVPTTMGKELIVFCVRLFKEYQNLAGLPIEGKLNGAVGNYNAFHVAYPKFNWLKFSQEFIETLGLKPNLFTTQILPYDSLLKLFQSLFLINQILLGFDQDLWRYISDNYFLQTINKNEVGSSTMPQKVNPIDFENSEGNLGVANALFKQFMEKLAVSRLQRDLSDKTTKRNIGVALAHSFLAWQSTLRGLEKLTLNKKYLKRELLNHWEIITEGLQTVLRTTGDQKAYEALKDFSRGKEVGQEEVEKFVNRLKINKKIKKQLLLLTPLNYLGLAEKLVEEGFKIIKF
jgi:adenylosuccinate lyase